MKPPKTGGNQQSHHQEMKIIFLTLSVLIATAFAFNARSWIPEWICQGCSYRSNSVEHLRRNLDEKLVAQRHVRKPFVTMIASHLTHKHSTSFHIAGDMGCGKTTAVKILAESLYNSMAEQQKLDPYRFPMCGFQKNYLILSGDNFYQKDKNIIHDSLWIEIVDQLKKCPYSLIVIDNAQYLSPETMSYLGDFLDRSVDEIEIPSHIAHFNKTTERRINKSRMIFGIITDFFDEGFTSNIPFEKLEKVVEDQCRQLWQFDKRSASLIDVTLPFTSFSENDFFDHIRFYLTNVTCAEHLQEYNITLGPLSQNVVEFIYKKVKTAYDKENGRGVTKWIDNHITGEIRSILLDSLDCPSIVDPKKILSRTLNIELSPPTPTSTTTTTTTTTNKDDKSTQQTQTQTQSQTQTQTQAQAQTQTQQTQTQTTQLSFQWTCEKKPSTTTTTAASSTSTSTSTKDEL